MSSLVIGGDSNIDEFQRGIRVAESNDGDVNVRSLPDGLMIEAGVGNNDQAGFLKRAGDVVGEVTRGKAASNSLGAGVGSEFEDSTVTVSS